MGKVLVVDVETTTYQKGNPYSLRNRLVVVGILEVKTGKSFIYYEEDFEDAKTHLADASVIVGSNVKFDYAWLRRANLLSNPVRVWDCQLWEFLESAQQWKYPDLDTAASRRGLGNKLDVIEKEYWSKGIDTPDIPRATLTEYLEQDLVLTNKLFQWQLSQNRGWMKLFRLQCQDLLVLQEMEWNGLLLNVEECEKQFEISKQKIESIEQTLRVGYENIHTLNFDSTDHLSCYLYGGTITVEDRVPVGVYKTGQKVGQTRYKIVHYDFVLPQILKPSDKFKLKKEGYWSTGEDALRSAKTTAKGRKIVDMLLERAKHQKLVDTYYGKMPGFIKEMDWRDGEVHGQLNQCVAVTGRLSASAPNQQNQPPEMKQLFISRHDC